ncbi:phospholipase D-like domain-containing protein [Bradyrhizobium sp. RT6a]|uniref:phospholipase D-like domain-containing protein n=1 Tax=Bradyrhizobium sp. RT6a TaxID=3156381 RepID=UPI003397EAC8
MPDRLVIEAMINLMRTSWVEVRSTDRGVYFTATAAGMRHSDEQDLPVTLQRETKWQSLCVDRLTGSWFRADELDLVYERDLPADANVLDPILHTYDPADGGIRDLFYLNMDEALEPSLPQFRTPSKPYARVTIAFDRVAGGLPQSASLNLNDAIVRWSRAFPDSSEEARSKLELSRNVGLFAEIQDEDVIVGGPQHRELIRSALAQAKTTLIIHSCFVAPDTVEQLLPELEQAALRNVRVELLWGLHNDPEQNIPRKPITDTEKVLDRLPRALRPKVQLSSVSSGSHAKVIMYDEIQGGGWATIVGSCNFLSTEFDWTEISVRVRNQRFAAYVLSRLIAAQLPASGGWSPLARRLDRHWSELKQKIPATQEKGQHEIMLLLDDDHYACVTYARDFAKKRIAIGCDLFGLSAETSVLVPMTEAASDQCKVDLFYCRASKLLRDEGRRPEPDQIKARGMDITVTPNFHAKFLSFDDDAIAVTSFNWMSTVVSGTRARGAEIGILVEGEGVAKLLRTKLVEVGVVAVGDQEVT